MDDIEIAVFVIGILLDENQNYINQIWEELKILDKEFIDPLLEGFLGKGLFINSHFCENQNDRGVFRISVYEQIYCYYVYYYEKGFDHYGDERVETVSE